MPSHLLIKHLNPPVAVNFEKLTLIKSSWAQVYDNKWQRSFIFRKCTLKQINFIYENFFSANKELS